MKNALLIFTALSLGLAAHAEEAKQPVPAPAIIEVTDPAAHDKVTVYRVSDKSALNLKTAAEREALIAAVIADPNNVVPVAPRRFSDLNKMKPESACLFTGSYYNYGNYYGGGCYNQYPIFYQPSWNYNYYPQPLYYPQQTFVHVRFLPACTYVQNQCFNPFY